MKNIKLDIDLSDYSREFISEIAQKANSAELLDQIVDFALNVDHYGDGTKKFDGEKSCYMDFVIDNSNLSKESIKKIIQYTKSGELHFVLVEKRRYTDPEIIELIIKNMKDLSAIKWFFEHNRVSKELAGVMADRIMADEIETDNCFDFAGEDIFDAVNEAIELIGSFCLRKKQKELLDWWTAKSPKYQKKNCANILAERIMNGDLEIEISSNDHSYSFTNVENAIQSLTYACSEEVAANLREWWEKQKNKS